MTRLSARFPLLSGVIRVAATALSALWGILVANPIGATIAIVAGLVLAFWKWGNMIKVTQDGLIGLKDYVVAAFEIMYDGVKKFTDYIVGSATPYVVSAWGTIKKAVVDVFTGTLSLLGQWLKATIDVLTSPVRAAQGMVTAIIAGFEHLKNSGGSTINKLIVVLVTGFELFANGAIKAINSVISGLNKLLSFVGAKKAAEWFGFSGQLGQLANVNFDQYKPKIQNGGKSLGKAMSDGFKAGFDSGSVDNMLKSAGAIAGPINKAITDRAKADFYNRGSDANLIRKVQQQQNQNKPTGGTGSGGSKSKKATFASELLHLQRMIDVEKQYGVQKEINNNIVRIETKLKRSLTDSEKEQVATVVKSIESAKVYGQILGEIRGPQEQLKIGQSALNELFRQGAISVDQYNTKLRELQIAADNASGTLKGGFRAAIAGSIQSSQQFGATLGNFVVNQAGAAADAIVKFAQTGKLNIKEFFAQFFADLLKLAAQRLLLQFIGGLFGIPGAGLGGAGGGIPHFATGGSIMPSGSGSTDSQLVAFKKRPDERVDILTPQQQREQAKNAGGGGGQTIVAPPAQVNVAAVLSPSDITGVFASREGQTVLLNVLQKNASTVRKIVGK
jgi:hypothetical protein